MNKKRVVLFSVLIVSTLFLTSLVSAQNLAADVTKVINNIIAFVTPIAENLLGTTPSGEFLFAKVLFLLIILAVVWTALARVDFFSSHTWVLAIVSIGVSILATRWIGSKELVQTIILPSSALGIAIASLLPLAIYFILVEVGFKGSRYGFLRRIAWILFAVIFAGLWFTRQDLITAGGSYTGYIYPVTAILAIIMASMDGTIQKFWNRVGIDRRHGEFREDLKREKFRELKKLDEDWAAGIIGGPYHLRKQKEIRDIIDGLS